MTSPALDQLETTLVAAAGRLARQRQRRRTRRLTATSAGALSLLAASMAVAGAAGRGPLADTYDDIFGPGGAPPETAPLSPGGAELRSGLGVGNAPGRVVHAASPSQPIEVHAYAKGASICLVASAQGAIGHCVQQRQEAGGQLSVGVGVVDGRAFVWGLASDHVEQITVSVGGQDLTTTPEHGAYLVALPNQQVGMHPITVAADLDDGTQAIAHTPGIPAVTIPSGAPTAPGVTARPLVPAG